MKLLMAAVITT